MECKVVLVGDSKCGKSALLHRFVNDNFLRVYTPTDFERCSVDHTVGDVRVEFTLWDTSGAYAYDTVRPLSYKDARAFLLCFDIATPQTLDTALKKWYPEIRRHSSAPIVLCGCRSDLRGEVRHFVTPEQAILACRQTEAAGYVETSAKEEVGVVDAFELCGLAATGSKPRFASLVRRHAPHLKRHIHANPHRSCAVM